MSFRKLFVVLTVMAFAHPARAQHGGGSPPSHTAPAEAAQFNFLIGQWDLVVKPAATGLAQKIHGVPKLVGTWKAWRDFDGFGLEDELRITDASGNPINLSHAMRFYDTAAKRWKSTGLDVYRGVFSNATAQWRGSEMLLMSQGVDQDGKAYWSRGHYMDISKDSFTFKQERSTDNGKTWSDNLTIEAKR
ncbi:MAG: hypothetical protein ABJC63_14040, partial [Gemmatimonadales bacterium]